MMKSRLGAKRALVLTAVCVGILTGCGNPAQRAANSYLDNLKLRAYPTIYQTLSHQDQVDRTLEQFLTDIPMAPDVSKDWFKVILQQMNYQVGEPKMEGGDKAIVPIKVTAPDLALWERTVDAQGAAGQAADAAAQKTLEDGSYPKISYDDSLVMLKEGGDWRVFVDYAARDKIRKAHKDAVELYHKHDYDKAIAAYQDLLGALDKEEATGNQGLKFLYQQELKQVQTAKAQIPDGQAYIPKLVLSDVDMKMAASRVPGIFGKITNSGDKAVDEVQMTVAYYEGKGKRKKVVYTEDHGAIATALEFTNFSRAVLPLVPGETRDFGFRLTAPADVQQKATPDLTVTSIVFTQSQAPLPKPPPPSAAATPAAAAGATAPAAPAAAAPPPMPK